MSRRMLLLVLMLAMYGCAITVTIPDVTASATSTYKPLFDCKAPAGRSYTCYSDSECKAFMSGYNAVLNHKWQMEKDFRGVQHKTQTVYVNLFDDVKELLLLGKIVGTKDEKNKVFIKLWLEVYNLDCKLLAHTYQEGYQHGGTNDGRDNSPKNQAFGGVSFR